jgi:hypothetical protein
MRVYRLLIFVFTALSSHLLIAQGNISPSDPAASYQQGSTILHMDKPYYVAGEQIWYKLLLPMTLRGVTCKVRIRLANSAGFVVEDYFLSAENASAQGYIILPYDIKTDNYILQADVADGVSFQEVVLGRFLIPIYNDLDALPNSTSNATIRNDNADINSGLTINITNEKIGSSTRSKNGLQFTVTDATGAPVMAELSVSVYDESLVGESIGQSIFKKEGVSLVLPNNVVNNLIYTKGVVKSPEGQPLLTNVLGGWMKNTNNMLYSKSDANGVFTLKQEDFYGRQPVQFIGYLFQEYDDIKVDITARIAPEPSLLIVNEDVENYISKSRERKKIYQTYRTTELLLRTEQLSTKIKELKGNRLFNMSEYKRFKTLADFFNELLNSNLEFEQKDGIYTARMYNPQARGLIRHFTSDPIFIVDGKITKDANYVALLDPADIETGELFFISKEIREQFGTFGNSAYVIIHTKAGDAKVPSRDEEDIKMIAGLLAAANFDNIEDAELTAKEPIFRPQIYWNPDLKTDANGKGSFIFNHSDDLGKFKIQLVARDQNGNLGYYTTGYRVARGQ